MTMEPALEWFRDPLRGAGAAAGLSALVLGFDLVRPRSTRTWPGAASVGGGTLVGLLAAEPWPHFPPAESLDRLMVLVLIATVLGLAPGLIPGRSRWVLRLALLLVAWAFLLLKPVAAWKGWPLAAAFLAVSSVGMLAIWQALDRVASEDDGAPGSTLLVALALATATVLSLSYNARLGLWAGVLAVALAPVVGRALVCPAFRPGPGASCVLAILFGGFWLTGWFHDVPAGPLLLLAAVPVVWQAAGSLTRPWARTALALTPAVLAVILVWTRQQPPDREYDLPPPTSRSSPAAPLEPAPSAGEENDPFRQLTRPEEDAARD